MILAAWSMVASKNGKKKILNASKIQYSVLWNSGHVWKPERMSFDGLRLSSWKSPCLVKGNSGTKFPNYERLNDLNKTLYQQHYITSTSRYINQAMSARHDFNITLHYIALHYITLHYITAQYISSTNNSLLRQDITSATHYLNNSLR